MSLLQRLGFHEMPPLEKEALERDEAIAEQARQDEEIRRDLVLRRLSLASHRIQNTADRTVKSVNESRGFR